MAPTDASNDVDIATILAQRGTAAPHLLAWLAVGLFLVVLLAVWRDRGTPNDDRLLSGPSIPRAMALVRRVCGRANLWSPFTDRR